jgi:hypothetical protein
MHRIYSVLLINYSASLEWAGVWGCFFGATFFNSNFHFNFFAMAFQQAPAQPLSGAVRQQSQLVPHHPYSSQARALSRGPSNPTARRGLDLSTIVNSNPSSHHGYSTRSSGVQDLSQGYFSYQSDNFLTSNNVTYGARSNLGSPATPPFDILNDRRASLSSSLDVFSVDDIALNVGLAAPEIPKLDHFNSVSPICGTSKTSDKPYI